MNRAGRMAASAAALLALASCSPRSGDVAGDRPGPTPVSLLASPSPSPSPSPGPPVFDISRAMGHIAAIAGPGPRPKGSENEAKAADYIREVLVTAGYEVTTQEVVLAKGGTSSNVIARFNNVDYSAGYILVGGHYDTVEDAPGANDNASGIGVMLAVAEAIRQHPRAVEFVAFTAEERDRVTGKHHEGSLAYVNQMAGRPNAMIAVDMVANAGPLMLSEDRQARTDLAAEIKAITDQLSVPSQRRVEGDVSDHTSFSRRGVPAILIWTMRHASFHKPSDTLAVVRQDAVERAAAVVLAWVRARAAI